MIRFRGVWLNLLPRFHSTALQEGYALDDGVVTAVVKACCRAGRPSEAEAVLEKSLARGLVPEVQRAHPSQPSPLPAFFDLM